jgi:quinol monooxygenase YgiN
LKAIIAKAKVQAGKEAEFEKIALELAAQVEANEPGNTLYKLCKSADGDYLIIELYESDQAIADHVAAPHMKEAGPKFFALMAGAPEIAVVDVLGD